MNMDEMRECNIGNCPRWGVWSEWSECPVTCGNGSVKRNRDCLYSSDPAACGAGTLGGAGTEEKECSRRPCPFWSEWKEWNSCTASCGGGKRRRSRGCMYGPGCAGGKMSAFIIESCNEESCAAWGDWAEWEQCSETCGTGSRLRSRQCHGDGDCNGATYETGECEAGPCPVWTQWSSYSTCSATCGAGSKVRSRKCPGGIVGFDCFGTETDSTSCNLGACPSWSNWSTFSKCSATCGSATKQRQRTCNNGMAGTDCAGATADVQSCNAPTCSSWSNWTAYSSCSVTCGAGTQLRSRSCTNGNNCLGDMTDTRKCSQPACPDWSTWSAYSACSATCGGGSQLRTRKCEGGVAGRDCSGNGTESIDCNQQQCVAAFDEWAQWSKCSVTCGTNGKSHRRRKCNLSQRECYGKMLETKTCGAAPCASNQWLEWNAWSTCTATCGGGMHYRDRSCDGSGCRGQGFETGTCNMDSCDAGCPGQRDVLFVVHSTKHMRSSFEHIKSFFHSIIKEINIEPSRDSIKFSMALYSYNYETFFDFNMLTSLTEYGWAFEAVPEPRQTQNYLGNALQHAAQEMFDFY